MDKSIQNTHIKPTVEHMKCSLERKNRIIRKFILAEYGRDDYRIRKISDYKNFPTFSNF